MAYSIAAFIGTLLINIAAAVIFNKGQSGFEAALLPACLLGTAILGAVLVFAKSASENTKRAGWGLIGGSVTSLVLGGLVMFWIVQSMTNSSLGN